jgi:hypothetical protein
MQHALLVRRREPRAELRRYLYCFVRGQPAYAPEKRCEIFAVDVLHREKVLPVDFAYIINAAYIRVRNLAGNSDFAVKPLKHRAVFF